MHLSGPRNNTYSATCPIEATRTLRPSSICGRTTGSPFSSCSSVDRARSRWKSWPGLVSGAWGMGIVTVPCSARMHRSDLGQYYAMGVRSVLSRRVLVHCGGLDARRNRRTGRAGGNRSSSLARRPPVRIGRGPRRGVTFPGLREAARLTADPSILPARHFTENRRWREMLQRADRFFNVVGRSIDEGRSSYASAYSQARCATLFVVSRHSSTSSSSTLRPTTLKKAIGAESKLSHHRSDFGEYWLCGKESGGQSVRPPKPRKHVDARPMRTGCRLASKEERFCRWLGQCVDVPRVSSLPQCVRP